jgi:hypothetical protein
MGGIAQSHDRGFVNRSLKKGERQGFRVKKFKIEGFENFSLKTFDITQANNRRNE